MSFNERGKSKLVKKYSPIKSFCTFVLLKFLVSTCPFYI
nr:MAG TPA: hypothetical protein [Caudoviricetes sp.]